MGELTGIKGNERLIAGLRNAVALNRAANTYVLWGAEGSGKTTAAYALAKALLCQSPVDGDACGVCRSCAMFERGNNPDAFFVKPPKPKERKTLGVDDARELVGREMETAPYMFGRKVFIIDRADELLTPQAQNALLKTLEDGAPYGCFLLTAENLGKLLPTVLSRAVCLKMAVLSDKAVEAALVAKGVSAEAARAAAAFADGSIGKAEKRASDADFAAMRDEVADVMRVIRSQGKVDVLLAAKVFESRKERVAEMLELTRAWLRDVAVYAGTGDGGLVVNASRLTDIAAAAVDFGAYEAALCAERVNAARDRLARNANFILTVEIMLLEISGVKFAAKGLFDGEFQ